MHLLKNVQFSSVQSLNRVRLFATPWIAARQASLVHHQFLEFTQTHVHRVVDAVQPPHPLSSPSPPAPNPSQHQGLFQWVNSSHRWPKYWSFSFSIIPSKEIPGLISFRRSTTVSPVSPSICHEVMGPDAMILVFWMWVLSHTFRLIHTHTFTHLNIITC